MLRNPLSLRALCQPAMGAKPAGSSSASRQQRASAAAAAVPPEVLPATAEAPVVLRYGRLMRGQLVRRYKRFLGDVRLQLAGTEAGAGEAAAVSGAAAAAAERPPAAGEQAMTVVHVPNTGPMTGLLDSLPASALLSVSADAKRKYQHTLEWLQPEGRQGSSWVGTHSAKANAMVRCLLEQRLLPQLPPYERVQAEVRYGADGKSRVDFVLHSSHSGSGTAADGSSSAVGGSKGVLAKRRHTGKSSSKAAAAAAAAAAVAGTAAAAEPAAAAEAAAWAAGAAEAAAWAAGAADAAEETAGVAAAAPGSCTYVEVKSVTLAEDRAEGGGRIALFPDTVSERAQRHVRELTALARAGHAAALVFVVQRDDCCAFAPCHEKDPQYGRLVREAAAAGVLLLPLVCSLDEAAQVVRFRGTLPVDLNHMWQGS